MRLPLILLILLLSIYTQAQTFYCGNDLSYVNEMEDCGAVYKEKGQPKDVYQIFADHGTNLVRVRLWYNPTWQNGLSQPAGVKSQYSDFEDVKETILRSKVAGMQVMLDLHLSDFWTDPGATLIPSAWVGVATNATLLADSVYNYVTKILTILNADNLLPEIVKIGNENNGGLLRHSTLSNYTVSGSISTDWNRHAQLFNSAIKAVRDVSKNTTIKPKNCLHYAGLSGLNSWYQNNIINKGVTDFDIIGFSYYYSWHKASITELGNTIRTLKTSFPTEEVMVVETGYTKF